MSKADNYLQMLMPVELLSFLRHLELGDEYLQYFLTEPEYQQLLSLEKLGRIVARKLDTDRAELTGNVSLIINTFLTAFIGFLLGLSGVVGEKLYCTSNMIIVSVVATLGGMAIGLFNYRYYAKRGQTYLKRCKLQALQMEIVQHLISEREKEIHEKLEELNHCLATLHIKKIAEPTLVDVDGQKLITHGLEKLSSTLEHTRKEDREHPAFQLFEKEVDDARNKFLISLERQSQIEQLKIESEEQQRKKGFSSFLTKMISFEGEMRAPRSSWFRGHLATLIISLIPTFFGIFNSTVVYFSGTKVFAREFNQNHLYAVLMDPNMKKVELMTSMVITLYFMCVFVYLNWKSFFRNRQLEEEEEKLVRKKNHLRKMDDQLLKVKEVLSPMQRLETFFHGFELFKKKIHARKSD